MAIETLRVDGVSKRFGSVVAVDSVSLRVDAGETLGLLGANGAGKTTLFGVIGGQHRATTGRVFLDDRDVTRKGPARRAHLGVTRCFQVARAYNSYTVRENLVLASDAARGGTLSPFSRLRQPSDVEGRVGDALRSAGLDGVAHKPASEISEGDRKRLDVARALVRDSSLLLLDEPTAGLSTEGVGRMIDLIARIREARPSMAVVITAHDLRVMRELVGHAVLMVYGKVEVTGPIEEVLTHPVTIQTYLGRS